MALRWKIIDISVAVLFVLSLLFYFTVPCTIASLLMWGTFFAGIIRIIFIAKKKLFWKVRNRLLFSGIFLVITPLVFISLFIYIVSNIMMAQYGMLILQNRMQDRLDQMEKVGDVYLKVENVGLLKTGSIQKYVSTPPNICILSSGSKETVSPKPPQHSPAFIAPKEYKPLFCYPQEFEFKFHNIHPFRGFFQFKNKLYYGLLKRNGDTAVVMAYTVNQDFLESFSAVSDFCMKFRAPDESERNEDLESEIEGINAGHFFSLYPNVYQYKYHDFDNPSDPDHPADRSGSFVYYLNMGKLSQKIKEFDPGTLKTTMLILGICLGPLLIISLVIGIRSVRVITHSINLITKGTQRIRNGDFSFRIKTRSGDQLQYLAESFNEMAAGIDRLLIDEKEKQRLEEELRIARSIQLKLLPGGTFHCKEFEIAAVNIPAAEIAGDYFDYFYKEEEYLLMLVADVSGKGTSAAFYMAELKGVINHLHKKEHSPADLIAECHDSLKTSFDRVTFVTMNMARFIIPQKKFVLARAGHTQAIYYNAAKKECVDLYPHGMAIGLINFSREKIEEIETNYNSGDMFFLFSDGLSEIMNDHEEMMGVEKLKRIIVDNHKLSAEEIKMKLLDFTIAYSEHEVNNDDLTFVLLKVK